MFARSNQEHMKKTLFTIFFGISVLTSLYAQDQKNNAEVVKTKMEIFTSKTGTILKFSDIQLPSLVTKYESIETRIRTVTSSGVNSFFYQIIKKGKYGSSTASIEYSDLIEIIKAINILKEQVTIDIASNPDYLENKFISQDGFEVGYYIDNGASVWYIKLERYGSDNTVFIDDVNTIVGSMNAAKDKIDTIKK